MPNMEPLPRESLPEFEEGFAATEQRMGFLPNSVLTMARKPEILRAWQALGRAINQPNPNLPPVLKSMVAHVASSVAGCRYCMAHTASTADRNASEADKAKIERLWAFESDPIFSEKEQVTLAFAAAAAAVPNATTPAHFEALRRFYSDDDIVEITAVIAQFGFLNRWNDTMGTQLERHAIEFATEKLTASGWTPGKHAATTPTGA